MEGKLDMDQEMDIWQLMQQLEEQSERDLRALVPLIQLYEQILERLQPDKEPFLYAEIQINLGNAYQQLPTGERAANLSQAITCYQQALRFYRPEAAPLDYAPTQTNLGAAYRDLPTPDPATNLRQSL